MPLLSVNLTHWRAKLVFVLAIATVAVNITPAPMFDISSHKEKAIKVTFQSGDNGYFTNLKLSAEEVEAKNQKPVWETVKNQANENSSDEDDFVFAGWYSYDSKYPVRVGNYKEETTYSASTPQFIKISEDLFAVMWEELLNSSSSRNFETNDIVKAAFFDGEGSYGGLDSSSLPSYVKKGEWLMLNGSWHFADTSGNIKVNTWTAAYNPYADAGQQNYDRFRFDVNGNMVTGGFTDADGSRYFLNLLSDGTEGRMMTGWVWIMDEFGIQRCYYFNPNPDGHCGKLLTNTIVEGYTVDANGCWTVNGVVQAK